MLSSILSEGEIIAQMLPYAQTAARLHYLSKYANKNGKLKLADHDEYYVMIVEHCLKSIESFGSSMTKRLFDEIGERSRIFEAEHFVLFFRSSYPIDEYCFQKTAMVLAGYIKVILEKEGIAKDLFPVDTVFGF